jgi:hypothetical protein
MVKLDAFGRNNDERITMEREEGKGSINHTGFRMRLWFIGRKQPDQQPMVSTASSTVGGP